ncbi:hypothetical protein HTZ85_25220 [Escherichia coli]|nr:hypothetical protein [Escherichia coli]
MNRDSYNWSIIWASNRARRRNRSSPALDNNAIARADVSHDGRHAHDHDYVTRVRDVDADTPARYNADPDRLFESSGCAGKLAVFAVRLTPLKLRRISRCSTLVPIRPRC